MQIMTKFNNFMPSFLVHFLFFCKSMNNFLFKKYILCTTLRISLICAIFVISYPSLNSLMIFSFRNPFLLYLNIPHLLHKLILLNLCRACHFQKPLKNNQ